MVSAVKSAYLNYAEFQGRATRSEYWLFQLAFALFLLAVGSILTLGTFGNATAKSGEFSPFVLLVLLAWFLFSFVCLFSIIPGVALAARRLQDANLSAWWLAIALVPVFGGLALLVMSLLPSASAGNRYNTGYSLSDASGQSTTYSGDSTAGISNDLF